MPLDLSKERVFEDEHPVRHLVLKGRKDAQRLIVVFSGFEPPNKPKYNYVASLNGTREHRVYILDDLGTRGCYYLGADRDFFVERSVVRMLDALQEELGIDRSQVVLTGSSKGASAALYLGVRHGYGSILAAAPQTLIGTYLKQSHATGVAKLIAGSAAPSALDWLDTVIPDAIRASPHRPPIEFFTSDGDAQKPVHVTPMVALLRELGYPVTVTMGDYEPHVQVGNNFKFLLQRRYAPARLAAQGAPT